MPDLIFMLDAASVLTFFIITFVRTSDLSVSCVSKSIVDLTAFVLSTK
ncbi:hypothetical protein [Pseudolactococcus insecticola]|nr:hypothetical protein [Lactococcus insecticola]